MGVATWEDWIDELNGIGDTLPPIKSFKDMLADPPQLASELICGILRVGNKMIITGDSKSGKTCLTQELAIDIAEGRTWLNKYKCMKGKVLYLNFEVKEASMFERFRKIYDQIGGAKSPQNLDIWIRVLLALWTTYLVRLFASVGMALCRYHPDPIQDSRRRRNSADINSATKWASARDRCFGDNHHRERLSGREEGHRQRLRLRVFAKTLMRLSI